MSRINTNVSALQAMNRLNANTKDLTVHINRLSTGLRINQGKDDPAGLIASENLRSEMRGLSQAIDNSTRANSVLSVTEGALNEVSALLVDIKALINASANEGAISTEEIKANQLQIDSAVASVTRIANSTVFEGFKLLNGEQDFNIAGVNAAQISDLKINETRFGTASQVVVDVDVTNSATRGALAFKGSATTNTEVTIEVAGSKGVEVFTFASNTSRAAVASAINMATDVTGVSAISTAVAFSNQSGVLFRTTDYGSKQFVAVDAISNNFGTVNTSNAATRRVTGADASVVVNGIKAISDGLDITVNEPSLSFSGRLASAQADTSFTITGGGAQFQLGPQVNAQQMSIIGVQSVAAHRLGTAADGYLRDITTGGSKSVLAGNYDEADTIVNESIQQVATLRGRIGAFQKNVLEANIRSLTVTLENVTASESAIRDADFAKETSAMTRSQILVQAGTNVLSIANSSPQNVLALLG